MTKKVNFYSLWIGKGEGLLPFVKNISGRRKYARNGESDILIIDENVERDLKSLTDSKDPSKSVYERLCDDGITFLLDVDVLKSASLRVGEDVLRPIEFAYDKLKEGGMYALAGDLLRSVYPSMASHRNGDMNIYKDADLSFNRPLFPGTLDNMISGFRVVGNLFSRRVPFTALHPVLSLQGHSRAVNNSAYRDKPMFGGNLFVVETGSLGCNTLIDSASKNMELLSISTTKIGGRAYKTLGDIKEMQTLPRWGRRERDGVVKEIVKKTWDDTAVNMFQKCLGYSMEHIANRMRENPNQYRRKLSLFQSFADSSESAVINFANDLLLKSGNPNFNVDEKALAFSGKVDFARSRLFKTIMENVTRDFVLDPREVGANSSVNSISWAPGRGGDKELGVSDDEEPMNHASPKNNLGFTIPPERVEDELQRICSDRDGFYKRFDFDSTRNVKLEPTVNDRASSSGPWAWGFGRKRSGQWHDKGASHMSL